MVGPAGGGAAGYPYWGQDHDSNGVEGEKEVEEQDGVESTQSMNIEIDHEDHKTVDLIGSDEFEERMESDYEELKEEAEKKAEDRRIRQQRKNLEKLAEADKKKLEEMRDRENKLMNDQNLKNEMSQIENSVRKSSDMYFKERNESLQKNAEEHLKQDLDKGITEDNRTRGVK